ncbi:hypothetical protein [Pseudomonas sp. SBB6]|nr:hypothetical protein [Pseudomonas sp. SBB6]
MNEDAYDETVGVASFISSQQLPIGRSPAVASSHRDLWGSD